MSLVPQFLCFYWRGQIESTAAGGWVVHNGLACLHFAFATAMGSSVCCCLWLWDEDGLEVNFCFLISLWVGLACCYHWVCISLLRPCYGSLFLVLYIQREQVFLPSSFPSLFLPSFHLFLYCLIAFFRSFFFSLLLFSFLPIISCWFQVQAGWYPGSTEDKRTPREFSVVLFLKSWGPQPVHFLLSIFKSL